MSRRDRRACAVEARRDKSWEWVREDLNSPRVQGALERNPACSYIQSLHRNSFYVVQVYEFASSEYTVGFERMTMLHLIIRRIDGAAIHKWRDLQRIKNEIVGPDRVAVEVYPPEEQLVDQANLTHLWVYPPGYELPFGLHLGARSGIWWSA
jgi:hypothetical protein